MENYAESSGLIYCANGLDPVQRWDGLTQLMEEAGLDAPAAAVTVAGSGTGAIVGEYTAYLRYVDRLGFVSNLSPISNTYTAQGSTGSITGATNASPIVITTSGAHGLSTGATVKISGVQGNSGANSVWTITVLSATTFSLDDSHGSASYTHGGVWQSGIQTINYTGIEVPSDAKVVRRQILRNTDGQTDTYYVDLDSEDITSTSLSSTKTDTALAAQIAVPILNERGLLAANVHLPPPNHKPYIASLLDRMFYWGQHDEEEGHVKVAFSSTTVTGVGTKWVSGLDGRYLHISRATESFLIDSVDTANQTLTLAESYTGPTDEFAKYAIRGEAGDRKTLYWSEAGLPESVPAINAIKIGDESDYGTGLMVMGSFMYVLESRHIHKFTFDSDPSIDGAAFLAASRGCVNNKCWLLVDDLAYLMDENGIYAFNGRRQVESLSDPIQEIFRPESTSEYRVNWKYKKNFHACLYRPQETIRWFVSLDGSPVPKHALAYNYRLQRWWVEEYPMAIGGSCAGVIASIPHVFLGAEFNKVLALWQGHTDIVSSSEGILRGTATSAGTFTLSDTTASFPSTVNCPLAIVDGTGKGQVRRIVSVSGTTLTVKDPWLVRPDATSVYQIGGIKWAYRTSQFRFSRFESMQDRRAELIFEPTADESTVDMRIYYNFRETAQRQGKAHRAAQNAGVQTDLDKTDIVFHLDKITDGITQHSFPGSREYTAVTGPKFVQVELAGQANDETRLYQVMIEGAANPTQLQE